MPRRHRTTIFILTGMLLLLSAVLEAEAQTVTQTFTLRPGWNAVFLEVEPQPNDCDSVLAGLPILSVWAWNPDTSTVEFIQDPDTLVPDQAQWMVYFPPSSPESVLTNLFILQGGRGYLVNISGTAQVQWTVSGRPVLPKIDWKIDSFNFVGFHLIAGEEPFFQSFFAASSAHADQEIYTMTAAGDWQKVDSPASTQMRRGEAFWVYCKGYSEFQGPLGLRIEQGTAMDYGTTLVEQEVRLRNDSVNSATVSLGLTGDVPLFYWKFDPANKIADWLPLPASFSLSAGEEKTLRVAVKRTDMTPGTVHQGLLEAKNGAGSRLLVPVSAETVSKTGLWVGAAFIRSVSQPTNDNVTLDNATAMNVGSEFSFRLIVHVDTSGQVRLLREVIEMWQQGNPETNEPGHFVLLADDSRISEFTGAALRDGQPVGRRISSIAFNFSVPLVLQGSFSSGGKLTVPLITIAPTDPTNPFRHQYHPDHAEGYQVTRQIEMELTPESPDGVTVISWGDTDMGGIYRETLTGLHRSSIDVLGVFTLHKVSTVGELEQ